MCCLVDDEVMIDGVLRLLRECEVVYLVVYGIFWVDNLLFFLICLVDGLFSVYELEC